MTEGIDIYGYDFISWDKKFDFVTTDLDIHANYEAKVYKVTFINEDIEFDSYDVAYNELTPIPTAIPYKEGYSFKGWSPDVTNPITADTTFTAQYEINKYICQFNFIVGYEKGERMWDDEAFEFNYQDTIVAPDNVPTDLETTHGLRFLEFGCDSDSSIQVGDPMPAKKLKFTALYEPVSFYVSFVLYSGNTEVGIEVVPVDYDETIPENRYPSVRYFGYDDSIYSIAWNGDTTHITEDRTVSGTLETRLYTLTFNGYDGEPALAYEVAVGDNLNPILSSARTYFMASGSVEGYTFDSDHPWVGEMPPSVMPAANVFVNTNYILNQYRISWKITSGRSQTTAATITSAPTSGDVYYQSFILKPTVEYNHDAYSLSEWHPTGVTTVPAHDVRFRAHISAKMYTVNFYVDLNDPSASGYNDDWQLVATYEVLGGNTCPDPSESCLAASGLTYENGFEFEGWFTDSTHGYHDVRNEFYIEDEPIRHDMNLYADVQRFGYISWELSSSTVGIIEDSNAHIISAITFTSGKTYAGDEIIRPIVSLANGRYTLSAWTDGTIVYETGMTMPWANNLDFIGYVEMKEREDSFYFTYMINVKNIGGVPTRVDWYVLKGEIIMSGDTVTEIPREDLPDFYGYEWASPPWHTDTSFTQHFDFSTPPTSNTIVYGELRG